MTATRDRLLTCFSTVFPGKPLDQLAAADVSNFPEWDSTTHILLLQVVEEEFGFPVSDDVMGDMTSFPALERYLSENAPA
jgi:acyl carrier protein